jgi:hypothetical protein
LGLSGLLGSEPTEPNNSRSSCNASNPITGGAVGTLNGEPLNPQL